VELQKPGNQLQKTTANDGDELVKAAAAVFDVSLGVPVLRLT